MKTIKVNHSSEIPENFTGIIEFSDGEKWWYKEGERHRENGPAVECTNGTKRWYVNDQLHRGDGPAIEWKDGDYWWFLKNQGYEQISLKNYVVLDFYKGKYNLTWYKLLDKDNVFEYQTFQD